MNSSGRSGSSRNEYSEVLRLSSESSLRSYFNSLESTLRESSPVRFLVVKLPLSIPFTELTVGLNPVSLELERVFFEMLF